MSRRRVLGLALDMTWLWFKHRYPKWVALVSERWTKTCGPPGGLILTHTHFGHVTTVVFVNISVCGWCATTP